MLHDKLTVRTEEIAAFCRRNHMRRLARFGSVCAKRRSTMSRHKDRARLRRMLAGAR